MYCSFKTKLGKKNLHIHIPVFSSRVLGVLGRLIISTNWFRTIAMYGCISTPGRAQNVSEMHISIQYVSLISKGTSQLHIKIFCNLPICMQISPMAHVALLQTEMNSGFRFVPRIGMNSAEERTRKVIMRFPTKEITRYFLCCMCICVKKQKV